MKTGKIIFLNGVSSSGKSLIAKVLQQILDELFLHYAVDDFLNMLPEKYISPDDQNKLSEEDIKALEALFSRAISGMHRCIATLASEGINLIVDHVLQSPEWLRECVNLLVDFPVLFVGVRCPLEELERRERERDREPGLARKQFDIVHAHGIYDVEVDTSIYSPMDCARQIKEAMQDDRFSLAFRQIKEELRG